MGKGAGDNHPPHFEKLKVAKLIYRLLFRIKFKKKLNSSFLDPSFLEWRLGCKTCIVYTGL
jgi:hypothetical protein